MAKRGRKARGVIGRLDLMGIAELQAVLEEKKNQLLGERAALAARIGEIDALLGGNPVAKPRGRAARKVKAAPAAAAPKSGVVQRPRGGMTLGNTLVDILASAREPMQVQELVQAVLRSKYPSRSPHLRSMVNQTLSNDRRFRKVRRGVYRLA